MSKLRAIVRYELLMAWRRRSLPILWILLFVGVVGFALLVANINQNGMSLAEMMARRSNMPAYILNTIPLINIMVAGMLIFSVGITLMVSETIPLDRQFKIHELLNTLPIRQTTYLGGKVFGIWSGLLMGWVLAGVMSAVALSLILGAYDLRVFALLWVVEILPAMLTASALSVLTAVLVGSRRAAVLVGLVVLPFVIILIGQGIATLIDAGGLIDPIYVMSRPGGMPAADILRGIGSVLLQYAFVIAIAWVLAWGWSRTREAR